MKKFAITLSKKAGNFLLRNFRKDESLIKKRGTAKEVHLLQDLKSDKLIISEIKKKFPKHNILTEESGFIDKKSDYTWIIDPLDGSTNFARGNPFFAVSIALMKDKELLLGVVYAPYLKELYVAEKGKGAYLNGKKIYVSQTDTLAKSYFVSCEGGDATNREIAKINAKFLPAVKDMRKLGSAALESASVAAGRSEAYIVRQISSWDVAAGVLLVEEAGGTVTDFAGKPWAAKKSNLVFSNGKMHGKILTGLSRV
ncbi:MAG: inositol monophosphatase family protein [Nanoarchaeota archaeon]